ncbi:MAG: Rrf2 family transcriptional regulator [Paenibacillus sp.]|nr:Rrf2 family transcriptional regulator [Paenibacillus sp.]
MKYSQATDYALHAMLYLVTSAPEKPVGVQLLAEKLGVSQTYLSKLMTKLVKAGLIQSAVSGEQENCGFGEINEDGVKVRPFFKVIKDIMNPLYLK